MKLKFLGTELTISFPAIAFLSLALISDSKGTFFICLVSSFFHELGHILALRIKSIRVKAIIFNLGDVAINADYSGLTYNDEIIISLSGVAVNLMLAALGFTLWLIFNVAFCFDILIANLLIAAFNLLPVRFLDGGQVILLILQKFLPAIVSEKIINVLTVAFVIPVAIAGFIFIFNSNYNFSLLFVAIYLICTLVSKEFKNVS